ncbi:ARIF-1 [Olene mendosa nucleopolyhedrovirus]|uniref:ARIF-1 n=1 Tax=Olene mendosa nucleopolyhedrovirus TaxID=2933796 RepID=A0AAX3AVB3_9ABAC|nr:ARIF-1 [Olene mendosa nucleopolyhedrovirus]UOQ18888.1 ARIF-1 [Olene mendosa nucleopolyhedrovirus]
MFAAVLGGNLLCAGAAFVCLGVAAMRSSSFALIVDLEDGTDVFDMNTDIVVYGALLTIAGVFAVVSSSAPRYQRACVCLAMGALFLSVSMTMACLFGMNWLVRYGHVPALDARLRTYDTDRLCWDGLVFAPPVAVNMKNCFARDARIVCALCRSEYYANEATAMRAYRPIVVLAVIVMFFAQIVLLVVLILDEMKRLVVSDLRQTLAPLNYDSVAQESSTNASTNSTTIYQTLPPPPPPTPTPSSLSLPVKIERTNNAAHDTHENVDMDNKNTASAPDYEYYATPRNYDFKGVERAHIYTPMTKTLAADRLVALENTPLHQIAI